MWCDSLTISICAAASDYSKLNVAMAETGLSLGYPVRASPVFVSLTTDLRYDMQGLLKQKIRKSVKLMEARTSMIRPGDRVVIKVNLAVPAAPEAAVGTHPELVRAVVSVLKERHARIVLAEDCTDEAVQMSGIAGIAADTDVRFLNLRYRPYQDVARGPRTYSYALDVLRADRLISMPKMKTHLYTYYTGAIKNMFGCIPRDERRDLHREMATAAFSERLVDIFSIRRPDLVIMDGILAMEGVGPTQGKQKAAGLLLISNDGVLLDYYGSALMGYDPGQIAMINIAMRKNLHACPPESILFSDCAQDAFRSQNWNRLPILAGSQRKKALAALFGPIRVQADQCQTCGVCAGSCPFGAIALRPYPQVTMEKCEYCFCCLELCPRMALMPIRLHHA